jgi:hypothetical protein
MLNSAEFKTSLLLISPPRERRSAVRFEVELALSYSLIRRRKVLASGRGTTVNVSSTGVLLRPEMRLPDVREIHLSIEWPASRQDRIPMRLFVIGEVVRRQGAQAAVKLLRYEFQTTRGRVAKRELT